MCWQLIHVVLLQILSKWNRFFCRYHFAASTCKGPKLVFYFTDKMIRHIMQDMAVICYDGNANKDDDVSNSFEHTFWVFFSLDHLVSNELRSLELPPPQKKPPGLLPETTRHSLLHLIRWGFRGASCDKIDCWRLHPQATWTIHLEDHPS